MLDYETFEKCINALMEDDKYYDRCYDVGLQIFEHIHSETELLNLLSISMNDGGDYIGWWCYEKSFGKDENIQCFDENDNIIPMSTVRELYDFLMDNAKHYNGKKPEKGETDSEYLCPTCKSKVVKNQNYCSECGEKIDWKE